MRVQQHHRTATNGPIHPVTADDTTGTAPNLLLLAFGVEGSAPLSLVCLTTGPTRSTLDGHVQHRAPQFPLATWAAQFNIPSAFQWGETRGRHEGFSRTAITARQPTADTRLSYHSGTYHLTVLNPHRALFRIQHWVWRCFGFDIEPGIPDGDTDTTALIIHGVGIGSELKRRGDA